MSFRELPLINISKSKAMKLESINPFTNELIESFESFTDSMVEECINKANKAQISWRKVPLTSRTEILRKLSTGLRTNAESYAACITREMGKPIKESLLEIKKCAWLCSYYADEGPEFLSEENIQTDASYSFIKYDPLGVILAIMPWNYPFWQVFRCAVPSILAGNAVLLKHASNVQRCALIIEELMKQAGLPEGIFQTLVISSNDTGNVIKHPCIRSVSLTGSEAAGSVVAEIAGSNLKKTVLELGGSNAFIVLEDADIEAATTTGVQSRMQNAGQSCIAAKRFILHEKIAESFMHLFVEKMLKLRMGDPMDPNTEMGPLASLKQSEKLEEQLERSIKSGARLISGGIRKNCFFSPTLIDLVTPGMAVFEEETFGPIAPMILARNMEEAIELANQTQYGLGVSIFTRNIEKALNLASEFDDGAIFINSLVKSDPRLPFGGTKKSGYGRELARAGIMEFVNAKTVFIQ
jgi:succinate-semialdehyde dehydrogenase/glutarate-semialdehyde dehydrogenase